MNAAQKKKLCWNCEGRVPLESENCPYCAVYLGPAPGDKGGKGVLVPPYKIIETEEQDESLPEDQSTDIQEENQNVQEHEEDLVASQKNDVKEVLLPIAMLSGGALFSLFGLILFLFSEQGVLHLRWNGEYWYIYLALALPMLFLGWRSLRNVEET